MAINPIVNVLRAIIKDRLTDLIGSETFVALGLAAVEKKINAWLGEETTEQGLERATIEADNIFQARVADPILKEWIHSLPIRKLPDVLKALEDLPNAPDETQLRDSLREAIED